MITLCGFSFSNYYNIVKLALLEKELPFTEERVMTGSTDEAVLQASPLGKVPYIRTADGGLCETGVLLDYIESHAGPALLPKDSFQAAKVRELVTFINLHLELVARELYPQAFFGGTVSEGTQERVRKTLVKNIAAFKRLAQFSPYVAGETFTLADCVASINLPIIGMATKAVLGEDLLAAAGIEVKPYASFIGQRPHAQQVAADRKADMKRS